MFDTVGKKKWLKLIFIFAAAVRSKAFDRTARFIGDEIEPFAKYRTDRSRGFVFEEVDPNIPRIVIDEGDEVEILSI
jgi:hypothetical protein